jgi:hypothetical protein
MTEIIMAYGDSQTHRKQELYMTDKFQKSGNRKQSWME